MLQETRGIVLRVIPYGETSIITNIFTEHFGVQSFMVKGVRTASSKRHKAALFQPATLLQLVIYQQPQGNLQYLREFNRFFLFSSIPEEVIKHSILLFSVELLLRLLPESAAVQELFRFAVQYFISLDQFRVAEVANFPLFFIKEASSLLGYQLIGDYSEHTPHLHLQAGGFSEEMPTLQPFMSDEDAALLSGLMKINEAADLKTISMNAAARNRLLDWYIAFLQQHAQHLGQIKSLAVLRAVLH